MQALIMCLSVAFSFLVDTIVLPRISLFGIHPDTILIMVVLFAILGGGTRGVLAGVVAGLAVDVLFGMYIGLTALLYLMVGVLAGVFYSRFYANNFLLPALVCGAGVILKETLTGLFLMLMGAGFNLAAILVRYVVPSALLTAAVSIPLFLLYRHLFAKQTRRRGRYDL